MSLLSLKLKLRQYKLKNHQYISVYELSRVCPIIIFEYRIKTIADVFTAQK